MRTFFELIWQGLAGEYPPSVKFTFIAAGAGALILCLYSIVFHELGHAYAAKRNGDLTSQSYGRITLNPFKHLDLFGFIAMMLVGFGWAKPVPVNPNNFHNYRKGMFQVAIAGVTVNLILAIIFCPLYLLFENLGLIAFSYMFMVAFYLNIALIIFNLIPIAPLDGYRVIQALGQRNKFARKYMRFMDEYGFICLIAFLIVLFFLGNYSYDMFGVQIDPLGWLVDLISWPILWFWGLIF